MSFVSVWNMRHWPLCREFTGHECMFLSFECHIYRESQNVVNAIIKIDSGLATNYNSVTSLNDFQSSPLSAVYLR